MEIRIKNTVENEDLEEINPENIAGILKDDTFFQSLLETYSMEDTKTETLGHGIEHVLWATARAVNIANVLKNDEFLKEKNRDMEIDIDLKQLIYSAMAHDIGNAISRKGHNHFAFGILNGELSLQNILSVPLQAGGDTLNDSQRQFIDGLLISDSEDGHREDPNKILFNHDNRDVLGKILLNLKYELNVPDGKHQKNLSFDDVRTAVFKNNDLSILTDHQLDVLKKAIEQANIPQDQKNEINKAIGEMLSDEEEEFLVNAMATKIKFTIGYDGVDQFNYEGRKGKITDVKDIKRADIIEFLKNSDEFKNIPPQLYEWVAENLVKVEDGKEQPINDLQYDPRLKDITKAFYETFLTKKELDMLKNENGEIKIPVPEEIREKLSEETKEKMMQICKAVQHHNIDFDIREGILCRFIPESIIGQIINDADKDTNIESFLQRSIAFSVKKFHMSIEEAIPNVMGQFWQRGRMPAKTWDEAVNQTVPFTTKTVGQLEDVKGVLVGDDAKEYLNDHKDEISKQYGVKPEEVDNLLKTFRDEKTGKTTTYVILQQLGDDTHSTIMNALLGKEYENMSDEEKLALSILMTREKFFEVSDSTSKTLDKMSRISDEMIEKRMRNEKSFIKFEIQEKNPSLNQEQIDASYNQKVEEKMHEMIRKEAENQLASKNNGIKPNDIDVTKRAEKIIKEVEADKKNNPEYAERMSNAEYVMLRERSKEPTYLEIQKYDQRQKEPMLEKTDLENIARVQESGRRFDSVAEQSISGLVNRGEVQDIQERLSDTENKDNVSVACDKLNLNLMELAIATVRAQTAKDFEEEFKMSHEDAERISEDSVLKAKETTTLVVSPEGLSKDELDGLINGLKEIYPDVEKDGKTFSVIDKNIQIYQNDNGEQVILINKGFEKMAYDILWNPEHGVEIARANSIAKEFALEPESLKELCKEGSSAVKENFALVDYAGSKENIEALAGKLKDSEIEGVVVQLADEKNKYSILVKTEDELKASTQIFELMEKDEIDKNKIEDRSGLDALAREKIEDAIQGGRAFEYQDEGQESDKETQMKEIDKEEAL